MFLILYFVCVNYLNADLVLYLGGKICAFYLETMISNVKKVLILTVNKSFGRF